MKIKINTDINAPCGLCEIVSDCGEAWLVQSDWEYPAVAETFGWRIQSVQRDRCDHSGTDGTVDCVKCGVTAGDFIESAGDFLRDNHGLTADDPGYFNCVRRQL